MTATAPDSRNGNRGLRGGEKRMKKKNNQNDEQKAGRGRREPEAVEREGTKKKKGTHFSRERPYSL
jgi:hypothetical protein